MSLSKRLRSLLSIAALALLLLPCALAYCDHAFFFYPSGARDKGNPNWGGRFFRKGPCLQMSGTGVTETYKKTLVVIDATDNINTFMPFANGKLAYAEEIDLTKPGWPQRPLTIATNSYCTSGVHLSDGKLFTIGAEPFVDPNAGFFQKQVFKGPFTARVFAPCNNGACDFVLGPNLVDKRWYPTAQLLADGRVLIVGGANNGLGVNNPFANIPTLEYFTPGADNVGNHQVNFLMDTLPFNLYPIVHLLPNGNVFIFAGNKYILWNTQANAVVPQVYPKLDVKNADGSQIMRNYPLSGASALFPLSAAARWQPEIMICGGAPVKAMTDASAVADHMCWRIMPLAPKPVWAPEQMVFPRVMPLCVLLPDGNLLIHGGARTGRAGIPPAAHNASLQPEMYSTYRHSWYAGDLGLSRIPRVYHASGMLLHDGSVFFSGSQPQDGIKVDGSDFPTEFRTEVYHPPYFRPKTAVPKIASAPTIVLTGGSFNVSFDAPQGFGDVTLVLCQPGFSTHGYNHGMRNVVLQNLALRVARDGTRHTISVAAPPNKNIAPPTWYWLFVVVDGVPNREGHYVFVK